MNHPLLPEKCKLITSSGCKYFLLFILFFTLLSSNVALACTGVITVVKNGKVVEDANPDFCEGGSLVLTGWVKANVDAERKTAVTYKWSTGATTPQITVTEEGKYEVTVTDNNGCSAKATVDVTKRFQAQKPIVLVDGKSTSGKVEICDGGGVKLSTGMQSDVAFVWEKDGVDIPDAGNTNEYIANEAGKYTIRVTNTCGSIRSDPVDIKKTTTPVAPVIEASGPLKFCQGGNVRLSVPKVDEVTYTWKRNGVVYTPINSESVATAESGVYTVEITNSCGAKAESNSVKVEVLGPITPQVENVEVCINSNATLKAAGGTAGNYRWYTSLDDETPDPSRRDDTYVTQILTQDAKFYVSIFNGACEGPRKEIYVKVSASKVANKPTITANGPTKFCEGGSVQLRVPAITGIKYQWIQDGENYGTDANVQTITESGVYTVILLDACGNVESENRMVVDIIAFPDAPVVADTYSCNASAFTLKASGGAEGDYRWYNSQTNPTPFFGEYNSTYTTTYLETNTTYYVSILRDGCESPRVPIRAVISGPPVANAGPDAVINPGESVQLQGSGDGSYEWSPAIGLSNPGSANPVASPTKTTTYTLKVSRGADCVGTDEVTVIVREPMNIPNAFSPNGDGMNDMWEIENINTYPDARIEIFNRWGSKVYDKVGYQNDWNGTYRGSMLPVGVYFYVITMQGGYKMTGSVSIVQ